MANPTTRVLAVLELLQTHGLISGAEMARRLGVDPRTLRRYIGALESLGIPVVAERGRDGGYRLMQGYKLPPMLFTNEEALALALGLLAARQLGLAEIAPAISSARAKLERVLPAPLQRQVRAVDETVRLDLAAAAPGSAGEDAGWLAVLSAAAQAQQRVHLQYQGPQQVPTARDVDPYGLAFRGGHWYLVGYCHLRQAPRAFRLDRILSVQPLPASFGRPADFDVLAHLETALATLPRTHAVTVRLRTDLARARRAVFPALGVLETTADGVLLHCQTDDLEWMARQLAGLPFAFEVLAPPALRTALADVAATLSAACRTVGTRSLGSPG